MLAIVLPAVGVVLSLALGGRQAERVALVALATGFAIAIAIVAGVWRSRTPLLYLVGGWAPPLGIALRADGLSAIMLLTTAVVICAIGLFAREGFRTPAGAPETRTSLAFWTLLMGVWAGLNAVWVGGDLFTLYVALELLTFGAVPIVCLDGRAETLTPRCATCSSRCSVRRCICSARRCCYGGYGTLDILLLSRWFAPSLSSGWRPR